MSGVGSRAVRLASEFLIIVVGVLFALGVDAWNTGRLERARGDMYLERIRDDLKAQRALLVDELAVIPGAVAAGDSVVAYVSGGPRPGAALGPTLFQLFGRARYELPATDWTYREMSGNAELSLIRDADLRRAIVEYHTTADRMVARVEESRDLLRSPAYQAWARTPILRTVARPVADAEVEAVLRRDGSLELVSQLITYQAHRESLLADWLAAVDTALDALDAA